MRVTIAWIFHYPDGRGLLVGIRCRLVWAEGVQDKFQADELVVCGCSCVWKFAKKLLIMHRSFSPFP